MPLAEVRQRGWVTKTEDLGVLENKVQDLLGLGSLRVQPSSPSPHDVQTRPVNL